MHYYQFNIGDYASHTNHLDPIEDIAYRRMLDWCYTHERPLPQDVQEIARLIRMRDHAAAIRDVLNEFFERVEDGWFSSRVQREIEHYHSKIEQASRAGKASAERRSNARSTDVQPTNNHKPITKNQEPVVKTQRGSRLPTDFVLSSEWAEWAQAARPDLNVKEVAEQFKDFWIAKPGKEGVKLDWQATWRNWVRNQKAPKQTFAQQAADIARTTVPAVNKGPDPALLKIEEDRKKATPMPDHIRRQIMSVVRKA